MSPTVNAMAPVLPSSSIVWLAIDEIVGAAFVLVLVTFWLNSEVAPESVAVAVTRSPTDIVPAANVNEKNTAELSLSPAVPLMGSVPLARGYSSPALAVPSAVP
jgi:hypothetical protein